MIIPLEPKLEGLAERRFFGFARRLLERQADGAADRIGALVESETAEAPRLSDLRDQCDGYTDSVRGLGDLAQLRWMQPAPPTAPATTGVGPRLGPDWPRTDRSAGLRQTMHNGRAGGPERFLAHRFCGRGTFGYVLHGAIGGQHL